LIDAPQNSSSFRGILAVSQAATTGLSSLPGTVEELNHIEKRARETRFTQLVGKAATSSAVLSAMDEHSWVHLACHASQSAADPTASGFHLHDGTLDIGMIAKKQLKHAEFAFLSACQTATGDENLPEEAVHLAAGMIMAGYPTVIATMWSIRDSDAPLIAEGVYTDLLGNGTPDSRKAARALHQAAGDLRAKLGEREFASWAPYIHIGV
jgi:CHAT domain-containing protein